MRLSYEVVTESAGVFKGTPKAIELLTNDFQIEMAFV